jgi:hypothetical protein
MKKRLLLPVSIALLVAAAAPMGVGAVEGDAKGPGCVDIIDTDGVRASGASWDGTTLNVRLVLGGDSCKQIAYTVSVYDEETSTEPLATVTRTGDGSGNFVDFSFAVSDPDTIIWVTATTSQGKKVKDRAPDEGRIDVTSDPNSPGRTGFN